MALSFDKVEQKAPELLNLTKLSRIELSKKNLDGVKAKVALVLDHSGSMHPIYKSGSMQRLAEKVLAIATGFDDDGDIDFFVFDSNAAHLGAISLDDYVGSVDRLRNGRHMGSTSYDSAFYEVANFYGLTPANAGAPVEKKGLFGGFKKSAPVVNTTSDGMTSSDIPVFAIFLTDGAPDSRPRAVKAITEISKAPIFWKFLSIGRDDMEFLQKLDDLPDRFIDNADYQHLGEDIDAISDKQMLDYLLVEFREWVDSAKAKGLLTA